jgi:cysteinyl-tRNA synthetase
MAFRLYNTMSSQVEEFHSLRDKEVRMYACGPTVYDYGHIGNFRTFIAVDLLQRFLRQSGYKVRYVMNITDLDDKIIRNAAHDGVSVQQYTAKYEKAFLEDAAMIGIERPTLVRATEHIPEMADFVARLVERGIAYRTDDGSYYFRIAKFPRYGKLSKKDFSGMLDGARVDVDEYDKDSARDFALWKAPKPGEASWDSSIGPGRPGWHLECSVMSMEELGESFDLHAGGEDLVFPHHENEIAQSESLTGKTFARFWFHVRFLLVEGEKMSKSLGNFYTLRDLVLKGHKPSSIRYLLASVPYRNQLNFTFDGLKQAAVSVERLRNFRQRLTAGNFPSGSNPEMQALATETINRMRAALDDDLNTAQAQAAIFEMVRSANSTLDAGGMKKGDDEPLLAALEKFDEIFAVLKDDDGPKMKQVFDWALAEGREKDITGELREIAQSSENSPEQIETTIAEIKAARNARDYYRADLLRFQVSNVNSVIVSYTSNNDVSWRLSPYKTSISPISPVAIKLNQREVHAPNHLTWGMVSCSGCKDAFAFGPNRIYGTQRSKEDLEMELRRLLEADHKSGRPHPNSYELKG